MGLVKSMLGFGHSDITVPVNVRPVRSNKEDGKVSSEARTVSQEEYEHR